MLVNASRILCLYNDIKGRKIYDFVAKNIVKVL